MYHIALLIVIGGLGGFVFAFVWEFVTCRWFNVGHRARFGNYHLHHSLFGPGAWAVLPWFFGFEKNMVVVGFGAGIIIQHVLNEGLVFISRLNMEALKDSGDNSNSQLD